MEGINPPELLRSLLPNPHADSADPSHCFLSCIKRYLEALPDNVDLAEGVQTLEVHEAYVTCLLHLFNTFSQILLPPGDNKPMFSVFQTQQISKCMEFVVCLGIYPLLSPGVSMPLSLRLENSDKFKCPNLQNDPEKQKKLFKIVDCFHNLLSSPIDVFKDLFSPNAFLGDYIAALLQLSYEPIPKPEPTVVEIIRTSRTRLRCLLGRLPRPVAYKQLFLFQSGFSKNQSVEGGKFVAPKWLRLACGRLITQLFITRQPASQSTESATTPLQDLIVGVMDVHSSDPRHIPAVATALAHILATPPQMLAPSATAEAQKGASDAYYRCLASQVKRALAAAPSEGLLERMSRLVAINTIHAICDRNMDLGSRLFLIETVFSKLDRVVGGSAAETKASVPSETNSIDTSDALELMSAEELLSTLEFVTELLDTRSPSPSLCSALARYSQPWFHFYSLLNLTPTGEEAEETTDEFPLKGEGDPPSAQSSESSSIAEFKLKLSSLLTALLNTTTGDTSSATSAAFYLLRSWLRLPSLDPATLKPTSSPPSNEPLSMRRGVLLRPASLVVSATLSSHPRAPFRVTQAVEASALLEETPDLISARVGAALQLLQRLTPSVEGKEGEEVGLDEDEGERILSSWTGDGKKEKRTSGLAAHLLLSLISDINSRLVVDVAEASEVRVSLKTACAEGKDFEVPLTASLLASAILETFDPTHLWPSDPSLAVKLLSLTISRVCLVLNSSVDKEVGKMAEESLNLVLGISAFFVNYMEKGDKVPSEVRDQFAELVPLLQRVETTFPRGSASVELAEQIRLSLCTRGAFSVSQPSGKTVSEEQGSGQMLTNTTSTRKPLIEEITTSTDTAGTSAATATSESEPSVAAAEMDAKLKEAFEQLKDPFIPVQGHALIEISRLLEARDPATRGFEDVIYETVVEYVDHEDSYIYLNAIRALSAIGNACTDKLLPLLLSRFLTKSTGPRASSIEFRLKVGEAIVRVLRELGEVAPKYRDSVVAGLTQASRDPSEFIRAASLSNLAEICRLLGDSIQSVVYEVFGMIEGGLKRDDSALVRKSAAYLARSLFLSSSTSAKSGLPANLPADVVRDVHRLLRDRLLIDRDEAVREQLEAAMAEVDARARSAIFCQPDTVHDLVKEIRVLRPFDS